MIIPSTVKRIVMICCVDGHDCNNDASEDDERAELIWFLSARFVHYGPVYDNISGQSDSSVCVLHKVVPHHNVSHPP
jgi:hypothetical protein